MATVDRLLKILDLFSPERPDLSVEEASVVLKVPSSTVYRYFNSLTRSDLLATVGPGRYTLGPAILRYDRQLRRIDPLVRSARREMDRMAKIVAKKGVIFLCRLLGDQVMCVSQAASGDPPYVSSFERGRPMPLHAGSASRVILANLPSSKIKALYRKSPEAFQRTIGASWDEVREGLRLVRSQGSFTTVGEVDPGVRGISVPIFLGDKVVGSLSIAGPRRGLNDSTLPRLVDQLKKSRHSIESELHHLASSANP